MLGGEMTIQAASLNNQFVEEDQYERPIELRF